MTDAYTQHQARLERTLQAIVDEVNNLRAQLDRLGPSEAKRWTPPDRWHLYVYGSQTLVTDEDMSVTDAETNQPGWRLVASGTEQACDAAASLMKVGGKDCGLGGAERVDAVPGCAV